MSLRTKKQMRRPSLPGSPPRHLHGGPLARLASGGGFRELGRLTVRARDCRLVRRMAETRRLESEDAFRVAFAGRVVAHAAVGERAAVVLDQSVFYPESGGQMGDRGTLAG